MKDKVCLVTGGTEYTWRQRPSYRQSAASTAPGNSASNATRAHGTRACKNDYGKSVSN